MGVTGLWKLIDQSGKEVLIDTLENKVLAIDISIWLHQVIKGFQDKRGNALQNAHLLGLFNRLCKLLFYRIKPVFVFDGSVPALKRDTIARRQQGRTKIMKEVERIQELLREAMTKEKIVQNALGTADAAVIKSDKYIDDKDEDGVFTIPEYLSTAKIKRDPNASVSSSSDVNTSISDNDSFDDSALQHFYNVNLQSIDVTSAHFKSLPADVRLEILADIRAMRKQNSWGRLHEMPTKSDNFSEFQMKRLLKRRQVQVSLEEAEKEVEGRCLTLSELETFLSEQGIVTAEQNANRRINSDSNTRFLLVKDLKKAIEKAAKIEQSNTETTTIDSNEIIDDEMKPKIQSDENSKSTESNLNDHATNMSPKMEEKYCDEHDKDLQMAIQLSLNESNVYRDDDYLSEKATLNKAQKNMFKNATGSARDYLLKCGLIKILNVDEADESLVQTDPDLEILHSLEHNKTLMADVIENKSTEKKISAIEGKLKPKVGSSTILKSDEVIAIISDDSENDSDFVEVDESPINGSVSKSEKIQIKFDPTKQLQPEEDIFADIFKSESKKPYSEVPDDKPGLNTKKNFPNTTPKEDISNILENLKKQAKEEIKLSLDDIKLDSSVIEIFDSQEEKLNTEISSIEIKDMEDKNCTREVVETPDTDIILINSQEDQKTDEKNVISEVSILKIQHERRLEETGHENDIDMVLPSLEIPDSQESINFTTKTVDDEPIVEILDSQNDKPQNKIESNEPIVEVIEILDNSQKTPSKNKIEDFFEAKYIVKKTPDTKIEENEIVPKVALPYFVRKSPGSSNKKKYPKKDEEGESKHSKVSKSLFGPDEPNLNQNKNCEIEKNEIITASEALKNEKSKRELETMATEIDQEKLDLEMQRNRQDRMGLTITEKMTKDCMDLLKLFGIPYIVAPMEAEAQCAFLENIELTDGTITDDSDIWLFGGKTVYKNFFDKQKHVLEFKIEQITRDFSLDREKLIQLAFLVGSDYTIGIKGVGAVTALEILAAFPNTPIIERETSKIMSILSSLRKFRDWFKNNKSVGTDTTKVKLKTKLKNIEVSEAFPNLSVAEAYLYPRVDDSKDPFTWGTPDLESIRQFTKRNFGWTSLKTDETLGPVLKRLDQKKSQTSIKNFFAIKSSIHKKELVMSKRVEKAVKKMSTNTSSNEVAELEETKVKKVKKSAEKNSVAENENNFSVKPKVKKNPGRKRKTQEKSDLVIPGPSMILKVFGESPEKKKKQEVIEKKPRIPQTNLPIPQREQDIQEMNKRKELASKLFKRTRAAGKKEGS